LSRARRGDRRGYAETCPARLGCRGGGDAWSAGIPCVENGLLEKNFLKIDAFIRLNRV